MEIIYKLNEDEIRNIICDHMKQKTGHEIFLDDLYFDISNSTKNINCTVSVKTKGEK